MRNQMQEAEEQIATLLEKNNKCSHSQITQKQCREASEKAGGKQRAAKKSKKHRTDWTGKERRQDNPYAHELMRHRW